VAKALLDAAAERHRARGLACLRELTPETVYDACRRMLLLAAPSPASNTARAVRTRAQPPAIDHVRNSRLCILDYQTRTRSAGAR